jgi:hypothetical protein
MTCEICNSGHIKLNGFCFPKVSGCIDYNSSGICLACEYNYYLNSNQCKCIDDAHLIEGKCVICGSNSSYDNGTS